MGAYVLRGRRPRPGASPCAETLADAADLDETDAPPSPLCHPAP
jgi:hypothetical protein